MFGADRLVGKSNDGVPDWIQQLLVRRGADDPQRLGQVLSRCRSRRGTELCQGFEQAGVGLGGVNLAVVDQMLVDGDGAVVGFIGVGVEPGFQEADVLEI